MQGEFGVKKQAYIPTFNLRIRGHNQSGSREKMLYVSSPLTQSQLSGKSSSQQSPLRQTFGSQLLPPFAPTVINNYLIHQKVQQVQIHVQTASIPTPNTINKDLSLY
jgi:hypothetical protein